MKQVEFLEKLKKLKKPYYLAKDLPIAEPEKALL